VEPPRSRTRPGSDRRRGREPVRPLPLTANPVEVPPAEIRIGMPVSVVFDDVTPEISIPRFRPIP
jgi:hypothetical protein